LSPLPLKVGSRTLTSYSYTNDRNKDLQALDYGNGDRVEYDYDDLGRLISQKYEDGDTVTYSYDNDGALARIHDSATGITTTYYYDLLGRQMKYVESGTDYTHSVEYTYNAENNLSGTLEHINGTDYATSYTYDNDNRVTSMTAGGTTKEYAYDDLGRVTEVVTKQGDQVILTEEYTFNPGVNSDEGGTTSQVATYKVTAGETVTVYTYTYDEKGNIESVNDGTNTTSYVYDDANQLLRENNQAGGFTHTWEYDNAGNIQKRREYAYTTGELGTATDTVNYGYGDAQWGDLLTSYDGSGIQYDAMGNPLGDGQWSYEWEHGRQLSSMETYHHPITVTAQPQNYTGAEDGYAVFSVTAEAEDESMELSYQWQYSTNRGTSWYNSSSAIQGYNTNTLTIQATEARSGFLYRCKITDNGGNVLYSDRAQIDLGDTYALAILSSPKTFVGNYGDTAIFAASADGEGLTYQWQYQNGNSTAWWNSGMAGSDTPSIAVQFTQAREVYRYRCKVTDGNGEIRYTDAAGFLAEQPTWNFTYDSDGMRTGRTDGTTTYCYIYNGSQLSQMTVGSNSLSFAYDANGKPITVTLNGTVYYYTTNLQGDVTGIWDASGNRVAAYTYDAWGNVTITSDHTLATLNPLTYRGYVYDAETELYYLQSRYYDPEVGRFINADNYPSTGQGLTGNNMFAYCGNNPVAREDDGGEFWNIVAGAIVGVASQFISGVVSNALEGKTGADLFKNTGTVGDYVTAALTGALCAIPGAGAAVSVVCDVVAPAVQQGIDCVVYDNVEWSWEKYRNDIVTNLVCDAASNIISIDSPNFIRDIKDEARSLGIKGGNALKAYLKSVQNEVFLINQGVDVAVSIANVVYTKAWEKAKTLFK